MRRFTIIPALVALWACSPAAAIDAESPAVYEIVAATVVTALPKGVRPFFETHQQHLMAAITAGLAPEQDPQGTLSREDAHYVMLDVGAEAADAATRMSAARRFPRDKADAKWFFRRHAVRTGGRLPWVLEERFSALVAAFQDGNEDTIIREAGVLIHLSADASLPFNTTRNREGESTGHLVFSARKDVPGVRGHRTVRHRLQFQLVERSRERFVHEVRVWPNRFRYLSSPIDAIFAAMLEAHADVVALLEVEREIVSTLGIVDAGAFLAALAGYYEQLADRAAPLMESRLEAGALLGANLIGSAWMTAGSPLPTRFHETTILSTSSAPTDKVAEGSLVGSRGSSVFHRANCAHAKKIAPSNLVTFPQAEVARKAGRRPCKQCSPALSE